MAKLYITNHTLELLKSMRRPNEALAETLHRIVNIHFAASSVLDME